MRPLFAYGTLRDPDILWAILGRSIPDHARLMARAPGYAAVHYPGRTYPALIGNPMEAAPGLVLDGLSPLDVAVLSRHDFVGCELPPSGVRSGKAQCEQNGRIR